jgi:hypothetical protein
LNQRRAITLCCTAKIASSPASIASDRRFEKSALGRAELRAFQSEAISLPSRNALMLKSGSYCTL